MRWLHVVAGEHCFEDHCLLSRAVFGAAFIDDDDRLPDNDDDQDHYDDKQDHDYDDEDHDYDLKSVKLLTPQHCCEDISRSQDTLT